MELHTSIKLILTKHVETLFLYLKVANLITIMNITYYYISDKSTHLQTLKTQGLSATLIHNTRTCVCVF